MKTYTTMEIFRMLSTATNKALEIRYESKYISGVFEVGKALSDALLEEEENEQISDGLREKDSRAL